MKKLIVFAAASIAALSPVGIGAASKNNPGAATRAAERAADRATNSPTVGNVSRAGDAALKASDDHASDRDKRIEREQAAKEAKKRK
jgi:hypothetical protein